MEHSNRCDRTTRGAASTPSALPGVFVRAGKAVLLAGCIISSPAVNAAELDEVRAAIRLRDYDTAVQLLEPLAREGNAGAQYQLAALYRAGTGVNKNHETAFNWLQKSARQDHRQSQYNLAVMYEHGWGVPASEEQAAHWYNKAALQGHPMALEKLKISDTRTSRIKPSVQSPAAPAPEEALRRAAIKGDEQATRVALEAGAAVDVPDQYGRTALIEAAERGNTPVVRLLLANNADANLKNVLGNNALLIAIRNRHPDTVNALLAKGADVNTRDAKGNTPLMIAAGKELPAIGRALIKTPCPSP